MKKPDTAACRDLLYWEGRLYAYAEGEAPPDMREAVEEHVRTCAYCKTQLEDIQYMIRALRTETPTVPASLHTDIMEAVEDAEKPEERPQKPVESPRRTENAAETPLASMVRTQTAKRKKEARIRLIGGLAAACVIAVGVGRLLPLLPAMRGTGADTGDASKVLTDLGGTGDGTFVDGVFVGGGTDMSQQKESAAQDGADSTAVPAEESVLGTILNIFSDKTEEAAVKSSEAVSDTVMTLYAEKQNRSVLEAVLKTLSSDGRLSYTVIDTGYAVTLTAVSEILLAALEENQIRVRIENHTADGTAVEIILH